MYTYVKKGNDLRAVSYGVYSEIVLKLTYGWFI